MEAGGAGQAVELEFALVGHGGFQGPDPDDLSGPQFQALDACDHSKGRSAVPSMAMAMADPRELPPVSFIGGGNMASAMINALRSLDYKVEERILCSADYGDPTTRQRLFIMATRGRRAPSWPAATHSREGGATLFGKTKKWRAAREVIDWTLPGKSIFGRKKPLAPATMARIIAGLERFGGPELGPFLVVLRNHAGARSLSKPLPTLTGARHVGLAEPFLMHTTHGGRERSIDAPLPTVTGAHRGELAVVESFMLSQASGGAPRSTEEPIPTMTCDGAIGLVQPFIIPFLGERPGQTPRTRSVDVPVQTITSSNPIGLIESFVVDANFGGDGAAHRVRSLDQPLGAIPGSNRYAVAEPFITKFNGTARDRAYSVEDPLDTVTSKERFGLCQPEVNGYRLDIRFRMLQPKELAAATSFPADYQFTGTREDVVKQIGNSWTGEIAKALCMEAIAPYAKRGRTPSKKTKVA